MKKYRICLFFILIVGIFVSSALGYTVGRQRGMALERARQEEQSLPETLPEDHEASNRREVAAGRGDQRSGQKGLEDLEASEKLEAGSNSGKNAENAESEAGAGREEEQEYYLVAEDGFLLVFLKDRKTICLYTHLPLVDFSVSEQERLREGIWFSSMIEVFNYLESCTS
ncbi:hypothetical protein [Brotaphodocola sp.]|uniref:hypothetical protein n=1 Tax=Brotaphodocola sp. TaxID=3073577 RepID=UPI003D7E764B